MNQEVLQKEAWAASARSFSLGPTPAVLAASAGDEPAPSGLRMQARAFALPLLSGLLMPAGEAVLDHADSTAQILGNIGGSETMQAAIFLAYASGQLNRPEEVLRKTFGANLARLATETHRLEVVQMRSRNSRMDTDGDPEQAARQTENVRKMLLAFSRDLRVVLLRLASRLQTLRYCAATRKQPSPGMLRESNDVFAPLANRLGIWQIKWEMEDLIFRAQDPQTYHKIADLLQEKRVEREAAIQRRCAQLQTELGEAGIEVSVSGRPKHIASIARKMRGKHLDFSRVFDVRALRVIAPTIPDCYTALSWVHERYAPVPGEFDDYIAKPKINGYQSLHTVVRDSEEKVWEIQIRTPEMHEYAEHGVAAHWAYKEAGARGYAGVSAASAYDAKIAVLRQLLEWERDFSAATTASHAGLFDDRIYALTPDASIVELPAGATPVDFAYAVHTELGHRCRGAKVDGALVPLNTALKNGQTVEITAAKEGGPSRDWLNPELAFLASPRSRSKVRAWFNAQQNRETIARGRERVEKLLQREGKTALSLETLAEELGFKNTDAFFETVGKDELSQRAIETKLNPPAPAQASEEDKNESTPVTHSWGSSSETTSRGGVLVVGLDSLLTLTAKCCKPAPPDSIGGYVTRGRGVTVHRSDCSAFRSLLACQPERIIDVSWGEPAKGKAPPAYPVDLIVEAVDRQGLLRDISEVFTRQKINVIGAQTQTVKGWTWMTFTAEVSDTRRLQLVLREVLAVSGVRVARRR